MGYRLMAATLVWGICVVWTTAAWAELPQEAVDAMQTGAQLYQEGEYSAAVGEFRHAYEISKAADDGPYALFLFNAARASQVGGQIEQAYRYYEKALNVDGPNALPAQEMARARGYLEALRLEKTARRVASRPVVEVAMAEKVVAEEIEAPVMEQKGGTPLRWLGVGSVAAGSVLLATAGLLGMSTSNQIEELWHVESRAAYDRQRAEIERNQLMGKGMLWTGGALALGGAALAIWGGNSKQDQSVSRLGIWRSEDAVLAIWEVRFD